MTESSDWQIDLLVIGGASLDVLHNGAEVSRAPGGAGMYTASAAWRAGAAVVMLAPEWLRFSQDYYLLAFAVLVMVLMAFCPQGLVGLWDRLVKRLAGKAGT